ncbi:Zeta toxin family protein (plasmid) [Phocaeicola salanitronis DSM 18170]|uniref:Zeta toxin family protein n=1 Tax=Phocaeicola salanitronis (strain DSM 18170 / JCM 13657 / CCUG 60908 / BL78) TaxID=667015 RepID=F0R966_PHOSB|nr:zeta toxin family protein [Phocaeicola salanitronis]ADY38187.1 Zeta toxin family protein [Phocaeicola salanitronis DSM 18170]
MQRNEVERIFEQEKEKFFRKQYKSDCPPIAIILGGQPACGKSTLIQIAQSDHPEQKFLTVNGDLYRQFHPEHDKLIKDPIRYPSETQIFSNVFTEKLIEEAIKRKCNIIVEGTMRNPMVPLNTASKFREAGYRVEAYIIAAPKEFTHLGLYNRYQEECNKKGVGRLADIESHNKAVIGVSKSIDELYNRKAVDRISIHSYIAKERVKDFFLEHNAWNCRSLPSIFISDSRVQQLKNKILLESCINRGESMLLQVNDKQIRKGMENAINDLKRALIISQKQQRGYKI